MLPDSLPPGAFRLKTMISTAAQLTRLLIAVDDGPSAHSIPWVALIIASFLGVFIYQMLLRRRGRRNIHDTMQLMHEGRADEAAEIFRKAVTRDDSDVISWFHLALCRELSGDAAGAREIYESIAGDPRVDFAACTRIREIDEGRLLDPARLRALAHFEAGVGSLADGDVDAATDEFEQGIVLHPAYRPIHYYIALCAEINGRPNEALGHYRRLVDDETEPTLITHRIMAVEAGRTWTAADLPVAIALRKAWNYLEAQNIQRAVEVLETLVRRHPDAYTAHFGLALCHILTGTPQAAREHYERIPHDDFRYTSAQEKLSELQTLEE